MRFFAPLAVFFSVPRTAFVRRLGTPYLRPLAVGLFLATLLPFLSACVEDRPLPKTATETQSPTVFGEGGLLGSFSKKQGSSIGVNSFLWRASLDVISFMPVASADPFGGVIITDWHSQPESRNERFKLNVYILGRALRADGVRVAVFRQVRAVGGWKDSAISKAASTKIEDAILTRARQLRNETLRLKQ